MKKVLTSILAVTIITFSVAAQEKRDMNETKGHMHHKEGKGRKHGQREMMKDLNLSDAQKAQMKAIREEQKSNMQQLKQNQDITVKEYNNRKDALMKASKAKREAVLTAEQKSKMEQAKTAQEAKRAAFQQKRMEKMKSTLSLTDDQSGKLKTLHERTQMQIKSVRENQALNSEEKKQQIRALKNASVEERKKILNAEQLKKMEEMKKSKQEKGKKGFRK